MNTTAVSDTLYLDTIRLFLSVYRYMRKYGRQLQGQDVSGREVSILRFLLESGPLTVGQCRDYLYISDSSTSEMIAHLEGHGFVSRSRSQTDNRSVLVSLTPLGRKVARSMALGGIPLLREKLRTLPAARLQRINEAFLDLQELLEIKDECQ